MKKLWMILIFGILLVGTVFAGSIIYERVSVEPPTAKESLNEQISAKCDGKTVYTNLTETDIDSNDLQAVFYGRGGMGLCDSAVTDIKNSKGEYLKINEGKISFDEKDFEVNETESEGGI